MIRRSARITVAAIGMLLAASVPAQAAPARARSQAATCAVQLDAALAALDRAFDATAAQRAAGRVTAQAGCIGAHRLSSVVAADAREAIAAPAGARRAAARAAAVATLRVIAADNAVLAARSGDAATARAWLTLRERRPSTRLGVPDAPAAGAVASLASGTLTPAAAATSIREDLDATAFVVLRGRLTLIAQRLDDALIEGAMVDAASVGAGWAQFDRAWRAAPAASGRPDAATRAAEQLDTAARQGNVSSVRAGAAQLASLIDGFVVGAGLSPEEARKTTARLVRFIELVPIEYGRGVRGTRVSTPLEIQEARSFIRGALDAWTALEPAITTSTAAQRARLGRALEQLDGYITRAETTPDDVAEAARIEAAARRATAALAPMVPASWRAPDTAADLDLVRSALSSLASAAQRGRWHDAEQARIEAYGAFEFGPELRLNALDPGLAMHVEELIWFGTSEHAGLATLVAQRASAERIDDTLTALDSSLKTVESRLGESATPGAIRTNSAVIVLREGMEAVLILAALTAGFIGASGARLRRPILIGGLLALVATALTFVIARALLDSLARFGERLEVVVSIIAIIVLLMILNWFVHKAYWTGWMANFQKRKVAIAGTARSRREEELRPADERRAIALAQAGGLIVLGFTSIYREGFETVLFLQALVLEGGTAPVLEGTAIGLLAVGALGIVTIKLQRRLPYRRMLIVTGLLIATVLAAMVGGTIRAMQAVGWMSVHPIDGLHVPSWMSTWLGVHPTWEAVSAQFASLVFVLGSYVIAEWWQDRKRAAALAKRAREERAAADVDAPARTADPALEQPAHERELTTSGV